MRTKTTYIAEDGTEFTYEHECLAYEDKLKADKYAILKDYIIFFDRRCNILSYEHQSYPSLVYLKKSPDENDENFMEIWREVVWGELEELLCENDYQLGWYIEADDERFHYWGDIEDDVMKLCRVIEKASREIASELVEELAYECIHFEVCMFKSCFNCPHKRST